MKKQLTMGRIVCYLFCLLLVCTAVFGVSYARYTASLNGKASAAVAAVAMDGKISSQDITVSDLQPGDEKTIQFEIVNFSADKTSEVAQNYTIIVKTAGNLPLSIALAPDGSETETAGGWKNTEKGLWATESAGFLPASVGTKHSYRLTVSWPADQVKPEYADEIDMVTLIIDAEQAVPSVS